MKFTRVLALVLVGIMAVLCMASCGAETINVNLKINCGDPEFPIILDVEVPLKANDPTVLQAFVEGCILNQMDYTLTEDEESVKDIDVYKDYVDTETNTTYYWYYTINGAEPTSGKAADNTVSDGDVIEYIYTEYIPE